MGRTPFVITGAEVAPEDLLAFYRGKVAAWQIPDAVVFADSLPHTATGKLLKTKLRDEFEDFGLPS
jgi:acyl-CoA synthetase (AMP-forming)/AMP-acid ligase II